MGSRGAGGKFRSPTPIYVLAPYRGASQKVDERAMDSVSQISQSCGSVGRGIRKGDHMNFPQLIDFGVVGVLVLLVLLAVKVAHDMRIRGEAPPGKSKESRRRSP
jgi:hypothetical protein